MIRLSIDAKASINIGDFSRGGCSRVPKITGYDHDFKETGALIPFGILAPRFDALSIYFAKEKITSDFIVDALIDWWDTNKSILSGVDTLVLNLDNGPDCHSRRTQFMYRLIEMANKYNINIQLAYYPPYHSKYNIIERVWGVLENHWNGSLLSTVSTALKFAKSMTWNKKHPTVKLVNKIYETGKKLSAKAMEIIESEIARVDRIAKWSVFIPSTASLDFDL